MLIVSRLMIDAASQREESRGVHTRRDFPDSDPKWCRHVNQRLSTALEASSKPRLTSTPR